ncbi:MAG: hypothetical protein M1827_005377 [Pycnora praestabilis]|nr:MAG: hypothetical protein M1827_005377 [Pycnora praestabilis]
MRSRGEASAVHETKAGRAMHAEPQGPGVQTVLRSAFDHYGQLLRTKAADFVDQHSKGKGKRRAPEVDVVENLQREFMTLDELIRLTGPIISLVAEARNKQAQDSSVHIPKEPLLRPVHIRRKPVPNSPKLPPEFPMSPDSIPLSEWPLLPPAYEEDVIDPFTGLPAMVETGFEAGPSTQAPLPLPDHPMPTYEESTHSHFDTLTQASPLSAMRRESIKANETSSLSFSRPFKALWNIFLGSAQEGEPNQIEPQFSPNGMSFKDIRPDSGYHDQFPIDSRIESLEGFEDPSQDPFELLSMVEDSEASFGQRPMVYEQEDAKANVRMARAAVRIHMTRHRRTTYQYEQRFMESLESRDHDATDRAYARQVQMQWDKDDAYAHQLQNEEQAYAQRLQDEEYAYAQNLQSKEDEIAASLAVVEKLRAKWEEEDCIALKVARKPKKVNCVVCLETFDEEVVHALKTMTDQAILQRDSNEPSNPENISNAAAPSGPPPAPNSTEASPKNTN